LEESNIIEKIFQKPLAVNLLQVFIPNPYMCSESF